MDNIIRNHKTVNERVQQDMANNALLIEKNREEWRNRMKLESDSPEMTVAENGNPFKPINSIVVNIILSRVYPLHIHIT